MIRSCDRFHYDIVLLIFVVGCAVVPCVPFVAASDDNHAATIYQAGDGALHINTTDGQPILFNGVNVIERLQMVDSQCQMTANNCTCSCNTSCPLTFAPPETRSNLQFTNTGAKVWSKFPSTDASDTGNAVATDKATNVYVVGRTRGWLDGNVNAGGFDGFLSRFTSNGSRIWTKLIKTGVEDNALGVATDNSNSVYVTGWTLGSFEGFVNAGSSTSKDIFLCKYDANGTMLWMHQFGTTGDDEGHGIATDDFNNVYVVGWTDGNLEGGSVGGNFDVFLCKFSSSGTHLWTKQFGTSTQDRGRAVAVDGNNAVYVTGETSGTLHGSIYVGTTDMFLAKFHGNGTRVWTKTLGTTESEDAYGVATDELNNVFVTGSTRGAIDGNDHAGTVRADWDMFLSKFSADGAKLWTQQLGSPNDDLGYGVAIGDADHIYITGFSESGLGKAYVFLCEYNGSGTRTWTRRYGDSVSDRGNGVATDSKSNGSNVYITGQTNLHTGNGQDIFLIKYS